MTSPELTIDVSGTQCSITGVLDFSTTTMALDRLRPIIQQQPSIDIDLGAITTANSAGLALLIECKAIAQEKNHKVVFSNIPDGLLQLAHVCEVNGLI